MPCQAMTELRDKYVEMIQYLNILDGHANALQRDIDWLNMHCTCADAKGRCNMADLIDVMAILNHDLSTLAHDIDILLTMHALDSNSVIPSVDASLRCRKDIRKLVRTRQAR